MSVLTEDANGVVAIVAVIVLAIASLVGLVLFVNKEETFEDVVAAQKKEQEALLNSLQGGKSGKSHKKWSKLKSKKANKKEGEEHDGDSGVDDEEPSSESIAAPNTPVEQELPKSKHLITSVEHDLPKSKHSVTSVEQELPKSKHLITSVEQELPKSKHSVTSVEQELPKNKHSIASVEQELPKSKSTKRKPKASEKPIKQLQDSLDDKKKEKVDEKKKLEEKKPKSKEVFVEEIISQSVVIPDVEYEVNSEEILAPILNDKETFSSETNVVPSKNENTQLKKSNKSKTNRNPTSSVDSLKDSELNSDKLIKVIESHPLNPLEVQQIIDILLAKQNELEQWKKPHQKVDPVEQLRKDLNECELKLMEERKITQSTVLKNKELKIELQQQKQAIQSQANEKLKQQAMEHDLIRKKMEEKYISEMQRMQLQIKQMQELIDSTSQSDYHQMKEEINHLKNAALRAQQLTEDNKALMNELNQLHQNNKKCRADFDNAIIQLKQSEQHQKAMHDRIVFYESEIKVTQQSMKETEKSLSQRIQEANNELMKGEAYKQRLILELDQSKKFNESIIVEKESIQKNSLSLSDELRKHQSKLSDAESKLVETMKIVERLNHENNSDDSFHVKLSKADHSLNNLENALQRVLDLEKELAENNQSKVENKLAELNQLKANLSEAEKKINDLNNLNAKLVEAENKLNEANQLQLKLSEMENKLAEAEKSRLLMESQLTAESNVNTPNEIKKYQDELTAVHEKMQQLITSANEQQTSSNEVTELNKKIVELEREIVELKNLLVNNPKLEEELKEIKEINKKKEEILIDIKAKNNELREKNWKAMDALGKYEEESKKKISKIEQSLKKSLKKLHPNVNIPSLDDNIEDFFSNYEKSYFENSQSEHTETIEELKQARTENKSLVQQLSDLKMMQNEGNEDYQKCKSENVHLRNVLAETETMLSRLQESVDSEVGKWQKIVDLKDVELNEMQVKFKTMEENNKTPQLQLQFNDVNIQLDLQKKEVKKLCEELEQEKKELVKLQEILNHEKKEVLKSHEELDHEKKQVVKLHEELNHEKKVIIKLNEELDHEKKEVINLHEELDREKKEVVRSHEELKAVQNKLEISSKAGEHELQLNEANVQLEHEKKEVIKLQEQLNLEKKEVVKLHEELNTATQKLEVSAKATNELEEKLKSHVSKENTSELDELNTKLKKTISERDLLIREFKALKEKYSQQEKDVSKLETDIKSLKDQHAAELKKLQDQVVVLTGSASSKGKGDKEKDVLIGKLYLEIQNLKEDLQDARDQVIVDMEPAGSEDLHKQVDTLAVELQSEKKSKLELSMKLEDLERSFQGEQSDKEKLLVVESKLKAAEARIKEFEAVQEKQEVNDVRKPL
ncbi:kinectin isoform X4 [Hydra vulgaris]|uniref:Kinectin isoform X4 n=1 Tax=Hydra vulgaris TaxID=6087 RepID=A0ABM4CHC3_HYDVU